MKEMKRYTIFALVAFAAFTSALSSCSKNTTSEQPQGPAIRVGVGVIHSMATPAADAPLKAIVVPDAPFSASIAGWEVAVGQNPDYGVPCIWTASFDALAGSPQPVELTPQPYYNAGGGVATYMKAWYPAAAPADDGRVVFTDANNDFKGDGTDDVMLTDAVWGSKDNVEPKSLEFRHLLTQLRFKIVSSRALDIEPTLTSISVQGVQLPIGLSLATDAVTYAAAVDYTLRGIKPGAVTFTTSAQSVGTPLLLRPFDGNTLTVDIVTSIGLHNNVVAKIDTDPNFIPGKAYTITLTYTGTDALPLDATVSVSPWQDVEGGDVDLPV